MTRARVGLGVLALAGIALGGYFILRPSAESSPQTGGAIAGSKPIPGGVRCASLDKDVIAQRSFSTGARQVELSGRELRIPGTDVRVAVVADAREGIPTTMARLNKLRDDWLKTAPDVVVALGGLATNEDQLKRIVDTLVDPKWSVVVVPGDRESTAAVQRIATQAQAQGNPVFDGAQVRFIVTEHAVIATYPGVGHAQKLLHLQGCLRTREDGQQLRPILSRLGRPVILTSYAPPRQRGTMATDLTRHGVHIGDVSLAEFVSELNPHVVLHAGNEDYPKRPLSGDVSLTGTRAPVILGVGALESLAAHDMNASPASYISFTLNADKLAWRRIPLP